MDTLNEGNANQHERLLETFIIPVIVLLLITAAYIPTFSGQFLLDDHHLVKDNPYIRTLKPLQSYFIQEDGISDDDRTRGYHTGYYRPLINISYFLDFKIWGMKATGFRTTNLALHLFTCLLLYFVLSRYFDGIMVPAISAILFGIHPVNTESVSWIASRNNILVSLFSLASFYFYTLKDQGKAGLHVFLSLFFFAAALFSKEFGVMLLPVFFLYNRVCRRNNISVIKEFLMYVPFVAILAAYFLMRRMAMQSVLPAGGFENILDRICFVPYLIMYNLRLVFFPLGLHSFMVQYPRELMDWQVVLGVTGMLLAGIILWRYRREKMIIFPLLSFVIGLFPILNIVKTSGTSLVSMRWLYFPMMWLIPIFCWLLGRLVNRKNSFRIIIVFIVIISLGGYSYFLNRYQWRDEWSFFQREVIQYNNLAYAGGFAEAHHDRKDFKSAYRYYNLAIQLSPNKTINYINFAALLTDIERPGEALDYLEKAGTLKMTRKERGDFFNNRGMALFQQGRFQESISSFEKAVQLAPHVAGFWTNLGGAYGMMEDFDRSISVLKKGMEIAGESMGLRKNLGISYLRSGQYGKAIFLFEGILSKEGKVREDIVPLLDQAYKRSKTNSE